MKDIYLDTEQEQQISLQRRLRQEILFARQRIYLAGSPTPLEKLELVDCPVDIWVKREDVSVIKAYKWRGAYNRMAAMSDTEAVGGVVTASAGNHAQGVALAAGQLGINARIFMPRTTPEIKQQTVKRLGGNHIKFQLSGDTYDESETEALEYAKHNKSTFVHAYDDLLVMAGQGTMADEITMSGQGPFDVAFLQIGGGGLAAGVACWLRLIWPEIRIIGVEGVGQASMQAALNVNRPVHLEELDIFCDGTAVHQVGDLTFTLCQQLLDDIITVTNQEVSEAIRAMWDGLRAIPEPSGAMGLAGALKCTEELAGKKCLTILCGANVDFSKLAPIAEATGVGLEARHHLRIRIAESPGSMLRLLDDALSGPSITSFLYGKTDQSQAWPVFGLDCFAKALDQLKQQLDDKAYDWEEVSGDEDIEFRTIACRSELLTHPAFFQLSFYERPGALHEFLEETICGRANICYFNYRYSGERIGRALIGLEFESLQQQSEFLQWLPPSGKGYRRCKRVPDRVIERMI